MSYAAYTWADLRTQLKDKLEHKRYWNDQEYLDAFNEALRLWNLLTGTFRREETTPTIANQYLYAVSTSMIYRTRMTFGGYPLSSASRQELNWSRPRWRSETTTSGGDVPTRPTFFAPVSLRSFYIWPADAVGGTTLTVDGVSNTPVLVEDGDFVQVGGDQINPMLDLAQHILLFKRGGDAFAASMPLFQGFLKVAADQNAFIKTSTIYRRVMGLDRRDLKPLRTIDTELDQVAQVGPRVD